MPLPLSRFRFRFSASASRCIYFVISYPTHDWGSGCPSRPLLLPLLHPSLEIDKFNHRPSERSCVRLFSVAELSQRMNVNSIGTFVNCTLVRTSLTLILYVKGSFVMEQKAFSLLSTIYPFCHLEGISVSWGKSGKSKSSCAEKIDAYDAYDAFDISVCNHWIFPCNESGIDWSSFRFPVLPSFCVRPSFEWFLHGLFQSFFMNRLPILLNSFQYGWCQ